MTRYSDFLKEMIRNLGLTDIDTFDLGKPTGEPQGYAELRRKLIDEYGEDLETIRSRIAAVPSHRFLFDGLHRFIFED